METQQLRRPELHGEYMLRYGPTERKIWEELFAHNENMRFLEESLLGPAGGATPITGPRFRWDHTTLAPGNESSELDFNIAIGMAIEIFEIDCVIGTAANTATQQSMEVLVDLDGPALAGNAISSAALFLARSQLDSVIANFEHSTDLLTSGGATTSVLQKYQYPQGLPWLTARNPGIAHLAVVSTGVALTGLLHRFVDLTDRERLELFALGRA